ncbi:hypothetical protein PTKIN_Ptkin09bG0087400 [Pterospermum kingtungense]
MKRVIQVEMEEEEADFLSAVAAAEESLAKRHKPNQNDVDGAYIAALRGSNSRLWQQINPLSAEKKKANINRQSRVGDSASSAGGGCVVPEKSCPCGSGACLVLTANTERNRGRLFYKCPLRQENGGCGFFMWCDNASQSQTESAAMANKANSCGFSKSCNDQKISADLPVRASKVYSNLNDPSTNTNTFRTGSSCFNCGKEGHWAKDCHVSSSDSPSEFGGKSVKSGTCYKCGKPGHWARDCTSNQHNNASKAPRSMSNLASY